MKIIDEMMFTNVQKGANNAATEVGIGGDYFSWGGTYYKVSCSLSFKEKLRIFFIIYRQIVVWIFLIIAVCGSTYLGVHRHISLGVPPSSS